MDARSPALRRVSILPRLAAILPVFLALAVVAGCGDETPTRIEEILPDVDGAIVPEAAEEGEMFEVEIWGSAPDRSWRFSGFDVLREGRLITVTPVGARAGEPAGERGFRGIATVTAPAAGECVVRIRGGSGEIEYPIRIHPRRAIVGRVDVVPRVAIEGTTRTIRLRLLNRADRPETLRFRTSQTFDALVKGPMILGPDSLPGGAGRDSGGCDGDPQGMGNGHGRGGGGGGRGRGGDHPGGGHPGDPLSLVWNWAYGRPFNDVPTELILGPRDSLSFEVEWPGVHNDGGVAEEGRYEATAIVPAHRPVPVRPRRIGVAPESPPPDSSLAVRLTLEPTVAPPGSPRTLRLIVANRSAVPVILTFPSTQTYDFAIDDPRMMRPLPLWRWSSGKGFATVLTEVTIPARGRIVWEESWDGRADGGEIVGPGRYQARGSLPLPGPPQGPGPIVTAPVVFGVAE
ncbi:MAG: hypothetical protein FJY88_02350 [Candidatus Eisenbacteria bacterium]|nr:hypothetical protein [Candidatus Eisenbacteria bacterium]